MNDTFESASDAVKLAASLIGRHSITPDDDGCQELIADRLSACGFSVTRLPFGEVRNLWARHGKGRPLLVFAGHTDVVPPGQESEWRFPPFSPVLDGGFLYGRGACDMKCGLAAMITATERFLSSRREHKGSIAFIITSDEEGPALDGTARVVEWLKERGEIIDWCLVGEPSSTATVGDTVKNGRRGSLTGRLTVHGVQGHVAYPQLARNPIHLFAPVIQELSDRRWDNGNDCFPPTTLQFAGINAGTGADNVIPGSLAAVFNLRFSTEAAPDQLKEEISSILTKHGLQWEIAWTLSGIPFLTPPGELTDVVRSAVSDVAGIDARLSTAGGTSDGRFIAPAGAQVVELGVINETAHKVDERVKVTEIDVLSSIYERILSKLLG